jgi:hypothetical protein
VNLSDGPSLQAGPNIYLRRFCTNQRFVGTEVSR